MTKLPFLPLLLAIILLSSCASPYLKGIDSAGQIVYLTPEPVESSEAYAFYKTSPKNEVSKLRYLFKRFQSAKDNLYYRDGVEHNWLQAYRGGNWLLQNKFKKGMNARKFIQQNVWRSDSGKPYLVKLPDGSLHIGYYLLLNELDLLEEAIS